LLFVLTLTDSGSRISLRGLELQVGELRMDITDVRVFPVEEDKLKAYVTITLDNCFVIRDLKVINGNTGLFIAMPAKRRKDGTYKDIAHPLNADTRDRMERTILSEYERQMKRGPAVLAPLTSEEAQAERD
jgi:stage V sporulation protein G